MRTTRLRRQVGMRREGEGWWGVGRKGVVGVKREGLMAERQRKGQVAGRRMRSDQSQHGHFSAQHLKKSTNNYF